MDAKNASSPEHLIRASSLWWLTLQQRSWDICAFLLVGSVVLWAGGYDIGALASVIGACVIAVALTGTVLASVVRDAMADHHGLREIIPNLGLVLLAVVVLLASSGFTDAAWMLFCIALGASLLYLARGILRSAFDETKAFCKEMADDDTSRPRC